MVLIPIVLLGTPAVALLYFVVGLCLYIAAKRKNSRFPGSVDAEKMRERKGCLILAGVTVLVFGGTLVGVMALLSAAVAHM